MPDQWGRFTMGDGLAIANVFGTMQANNEKRADRIEERTKNDQIYKAIETMGSGGDMSGFSPEVRYQAELKHLDKQYAEQRNSKEGMSIEVEEARNRASKIGEFWNIYQGQRRAGDNDGAMQTALQAFNLFPNGMYAKPGSNGGFQVTKWDHSTEDMPKMTVEQADQILSAYMGVSQDELSKQLMTEKEFRVKHNQGILSKAEQWANPAGDIIWKIPPGTWGKDGKPMPTFFIRSLNDASPLPDAAVSGYQPVSAVKTSQEIKKGGLDITGKGLDNQGKQIANQKASIVSPSNIVRDSQGKPGVVSMDNKGGLDVRPVNGDIQTPESQTQTNAKRQQMVKELDAVLKPFNESGKPVFNFGGDMTDEGTNSLRKAMELVNRYKSGEQLDQTDQQLLVHAQRAVQMYNSYSDLFSKGAYQNANGGWRQYQNQPSNAQR